ncbi:MAG: deoxyhypusine synthase [Methanothrix sp.]|nr:deoxyhypusine synthase [Methanothrix sp.]
MDVVCQLEIEPGMSIAALVERMSHCGFGARRLAQATAIYEKMLSGDFTKFLTISGAMVPAGMREIISGLIRAGHVDILVITGANLVHDIIESFGCHCIGKAESDDAALRAEGKSRIYDVFLRDEDFVGFEELMQKIMPETEKTISGRELLSILGSKISDSRSILRSAYEMNVPVFCPALPDSMIGLQAWMFSQTHRLSVDAFADIKEIVDICYGCERSGIVIVGGGVPKNFALQSMLVTPNSFDLAIQLTTDTPENGGLSGATLSEAVSWGKISEHAEFVTVYGDATITLPMMVAAAMERLKQDKETSPRDHSG